ncbi:hypothetical protein [Nocardia wallacei]|uniref:Uncharacterized protein n=1 Tax=Nocardia wallacei TaxID=480035 RepID=A0A7G1KK44_9NOCA|nr:hypothetical protein [Nocardia wallacei]BCK55635.1 hypothetical protein NWFMUON74_34070 [Nocardia wallacei]
MTVRSNITPTVSRENDEAAPDEAVVWPEPSPLTSWWQQVMQAPAERSPAPGAL